MYRLLFFLVIFTSITQNKSNYEFYEYDENDTLEIINSMISVEENWESEVYSRERFGRKIGGGTRARIDQFPYEVSIRLRYTLQHLCSGTIISRKQVLTASHCYCGSNELPPERVKITAGVVNLNSINGKHYDVKHLICHPEFDETIIVNDIGLIIIEQSFEASNSVGFATLPPPDIYTPVPAGIQATIAGWGGDVFRGKPKADLYYINGFTISQNECRNYISTRNLEWSRKVNSANTCIRNFFGYFTCTGDSGGAAVVSHNGHYVVIGIVSWGLNCSKGDPTVLTAVKFHTSWILSIRDD